MTDLTHDRHFHKSAEDEDNTEDHPNVKALDVGDSRKVPKDIPELKGQCQQTRNELYFNLSNEQTLTLQE
jgi:hypothetical protein